jgi:hypothetical protein
LVLFMLCSAIVEQKRLRQVITRTDLFATSNASTPALSICTPFHTLAFTCLQKDDHLYFCRNLTLSDCSRRVFTSFSTTAELFNFARNCSVHRFFTVSVLLLEDNYNIRRNRVLLWYPARQYLMNGMYCTYFTGFWNADSLLVVESSRSRRTSQGEKVRQRQDKLIRTILWIKTNRTADAQLVQKTKFYFHPTNQLPENLFLNQLSFAKEERLSPFFKVDHLIIRRLPHPYETDCEEYGSALFNSENLCLQKCVYPENGFMNTYFEGDVQAEIDRDPNRNELRNLHNRIISDKCRSKCRPACHHEVFNVKHYNSFETSFPMLYFSLNPFVTFVSCEPLLSWSLFVLLLLNQLSFLFGIHLLRCTRSLFRWVHRRFGQASGHARLYSIGRLLVVLVVLCLASNCIQEYDRHSTVTSFYTKPNQPIGSIQVSFCFGSSHLLLSRSRFTHYLSDLKKFRKFLSHSDKEQLSKMLFLSNDESASHGRQKMPKTSFPLVKKLSRRVFQLNVLARRLRFLTKPRMHDPVPKSDKFNDRELYQMLNWTDLLLSDTWIETNRRSSFACYKAGQRKRIHFNKRICFMLEIDMSRCHRQTSIGFLFGAEVEGVLIGRSLTYKKSPLPTLKGMVELRQLLLPSPYDSGCRHYTHYASASVNMSCHSKQECINLCIIDETVKRSQKVPIQIPFITPDYDALTEGRMSRLTFGQTALFASIHSYCSGEHSALDCQASWYFTEFSNIRQMRTEFWLPMQYKLELVQYEPKVTLTELLLHLTTVLSLLIGFSVLSLARFLRNSMRSLWNGSFTHCHQSVPLPIRLLLMIGLAVQVSMLVHSSNKRMLAQYSYVSNSIDSVPLIAVCFWIDHDMMHKYDSSSHPDQLVAKHFGRFFFHFSDRYEATNYSYHDLNRVTKGILNMIEEVKLLHIGHGSRRGRFVQFERLTRQSLRDLDQGKSVCGWRTSTYFWRNMKCFLFRFRTNGTYLFGHTPVLSIKLRRSEQTKCGSLYVFNDMCLLNHIRIDAAQSVKFDSQLQIPYGSSYIDAIPRLNHHNPFEYFDTVQRKMVLLFERPLLNFPLSQSYFVHNVTHLPSNALYGHVPPAKCSENVNFRYLIEVPSKSPFCEYKFRVKTRLFNKRLQLRNAYSLFDLCLCIGCMCNSWFDVVMFDLLRSLLIQFQSRLVNLLLKLRFNTPR